MSHRWTAAAGQVLVSGRKALAFPYQLCFPSRAGVQITARGVCWASLWPWPPLRARCSLLVRDPVLLHSYHVSHPEAVQDQPVFPNQGTWALIFLTQTYTNGQL